MKFVNHTPFPGCAFVDVDRDGVQTLVLALKATLDINDAGPLTPSPMQCHLAFGDVFAGLPGQSSLLYESDANWGRLGTDVALTGYAYPAREGDRETDVVLQVAGATKTAHVFGDRRWTTARGSPRMTAPEPFERIPLIYERAFGGVDDSPPSALDAESEPRNPAGVGLRARKGCRPLDGSPLPNVEDEGALLARPEDRRSPVGFTFVARNWAPRVAWAGTYDESWRRSRMPLLPADFDQRHYMAASDGLSLPFLRGGEAVQLVNLLPTRRREFAVPEFDLKGSFHIDAAPQPIDLRLDAMVIQASSSRILLVWHGCTPVEGLLDDIRWAMIEGTIQ